MAAITQLQLGGWGGGRYGSFAGRISVKPPITQLTCGAWGGMRYGSFAGRTASVSKGHFHVGRWNGKAFAKGLLTHLIPSPISNKSSDTATSKDASHVFISRHF